MGSTSDLEIMSQAINVLEGFGVEVVKKVISAHRTPDLMCEFAKSAKSNGIGVIIAGAGGAAHVAGVVAGMTTVPVIGVPIQTKALGGMDSLLSIVQMPAGIPVATMAINGAKNAGLFAAQILALTDQDLAAKLDGVLASTGSICLIIGSSFGLSDEVKRACDLRLSVSKLTFPHQMMRVLLLEMLYRCFGILKGTKYHK